MYLRAPPPTAHAAEALSAGQRRCLEAPHPTALPLAPEAPLAPPRQGHAMCVTARVEGLGRGEVLAGWLTRSSQTTRKARATSFHGRIDVKPLKKQGFPASRRLNLGQNDLFTPPRPRLTSLQACRQWAASPPSSSCPSSASREAFILLPHLGFRALFPHSSLPSHHSKRSQTAFCEDLWW